MDKIIQKRQHWKDFEVVLKPILENCEMCKKYGVCKFHEDWWYKVREAFEKI